MSSNDRPRPAAHWSSPWPAVASLILFLAVPWVSASTADWTLPDLPPMPVPPEPLAPNSVPMGDPADFPETKLDFPIAPGPYRPTPQAIAQTYPGPPAWLRQAKFGIWVHFGAQAAGQSGDWYAKRLYLQQGPYRSYYENHLKRFGHPSEVGYKDVLRTWNPARLDPEALVDIYYRAGARFLFVLGVHHDNFDNWDSAYQPWNSVRLGPRRDLLREWTTAARRHGMRVGVTFHHEYTWWWYQTAFGSDRAGPKAGVPYDGHLTLADGKGTWWEGLDPRLLYTIDLREYQGLDVPFAPRQGIFTRHQDYARWYATWWALRIMDVIEKYDPDFIYTDGNDRHPFSGLKSGTGAKCDAVWRVMAHYYNRTLARRDRVDTFCIVKFHPAMPGIVNTQEGRYPAGIKTDQAWIGETAVGDWFYRPGFVYDAASVVHYLLENTARDGATAVCVSLRPDGCLDPGSRDMLAEIGDWMRVNGTGIYGSRAWVVAGESAEGIGRLRCQPQGKLGRRQAEFRYQASDWRFTVGADGALYAYCMAVPDPGQRLRIAALGTDAGLLTGSIRSVTLLGSDTPPTWDRRPDGLWLTCPDVLPGHLAVGLRIETDTPHRSGGNS